MILRIHSYCTIFLVMFALFVCDFARSQVTSRQEQEDDIREAMFRSQFKSPENVYFLEVNGKDPSDSFMRRFQGNRPLVLRRSRAKRTKGLLANIVDRKTGRSGTILDIGTIRWKDEKTVEAEGGYDCGSLCMAEGIFHLVLDNGSWVIKRFEIRIQS